MHISLKSQILGVAAALALAAPAFAQQTVQTQYGEVTIPADPQRVVVLSEGALDAALALGIEPVGVLARRGGTGVADYVADKVPNAQLVGTLQEINVEAIVALSPDVILADAGFSEEQYQTISQIAPTVVPVTAPQAQWRDYFTLRAQALGKEAEGQEVLAAIEAKTAEVKAKAGSVAGQTAAIIRWMEAGPVVFTWKSMSGQTLAALGLTSVPLAESLEGPHTDVLSLENLTEVDADWLVIAAFGDTGKAAYEAVTTDPIYANLKAVKSGQVIVTDGNLWSSTNGPLAALAQLADVEAALDARQ